jgi:hypothetical protein
MERRGRTVRPHLALVLVLVLVLGWSSAANAAQLPHYDLDSLCFESQAIVLATKIGDRVVRVDRTFGAAEPRAGSKLEIDLSDYPLASTKASSERVIFLQRGTDGRWSVTPSGLRIFVDGRVFRFVQENNPGLYTPSPGEAATSHSAPFDRAAFEHEVERAVGRADEVRRTLGESPGAARTAKLLELVGPLPPLGIEDDRFGEDRIALAVVEAFAKEKNLDAVLDARARSSRVAWGRLRGYLTLPPLVAAATNRRLVVHRRVAALDLLAASFWSELGDHPELALQLVPLLEDPEPEIRKAVLRASFGDERTPAPFAAAIVRRFKVETDPNVRFGIFTAARNLKLLERLDLTGVELPLFRITRSIDAIPVRWVGHAKSPDTPKAVALEAWREGKLVARRDVPLDSVSATGTADGGSLTVPLVLNEALDAGTYDFVVDLQLKNPTDTNRLVAKRLTLKAVQIPKTAAAAPPADPVEAGAPDPAASPIPPSDPAPTPRSRSCGCRAVGATRRDGLGLALLLALGLAVGARRKRA